MNDLLNNIEALRILSGALLAALIAVSAISFILLNRKRDYVKAYRIKHPAFKHHPKRQGNIVEYEGLSFRNIGTHWVEVKRNNESG